jgi:carbon-monoxide dehydrogenase medium subunit
MIPASFDYHRANTVDEALRLLGQHDDAKLLAGGHSLIPMLKLRLAMPATLIDIGRVPDLKGIQNLGEAVRIGALTTHGEVAASELLQTHCRILAEAAGKIGDPQVRNKGTVGGNIAHADPASDLPAVLVATGATVHLQGPGGSRTVAAADFFLDLLTTDLHEGEILTAITVPKLAPPAGSAYLKHEHPASGYAVCGAAAVLRMDGPQVAGAALAFNGIAAKAVNATTVAAALVGTSASDAEIDAAVDGNLTVEDPLGDVHASGEYRVHLAKVYGKRALKLARDRARS